MKARCPYCMGLLPPDGGACPDCGRNPEAYQSSANQLPPGSVLRERYQLGRVLGAGGFGITYLGWDVTLSRRVAVKEYYPQVLVWREKTISLDVSCHTREKEADYQKGKTGFLREARTLSQMGNIPEIVQVYDFFEAHNTAYLVMEYLEGETFAQAVRRRGAFSMEELLKLMKAVFEALQAVHSAGLIHRDVSPDNLMILNNGAVKVMDFGCAREIDGERTMTATLRQGYAPPEQYSGHNQGPWTDVYALCAVMYYCLTGQAPPRALDRYDGYDSLSSLRTLGAAIHPKQEKALLKGLAIRPDQRWQSISELYNVLYSLPGPFPLPHNFKMIGTIAALVLVLCVAVFLFAHSRSRTNSPVTPTPVPVNLSWRDNVLMEDQSEDIIYLYKYSDYSVFGSEITRKEVSSITFLDTTANAPSNAWDVSGEKNRSVLAWTTREGEFYHLFIAGNGGVAAPADSQELFTGYSALTQLRFNSAFHTESVTDMHCMFQYCNALTALDVSGFDTSNVTDMDRMFDRCSNLTALDVSGFNTSNVTNMDWMFAYCSGLTTIYASERFVTEQVTSLFRDTCFSGCTSLVGGNGTAYSDAHTDTEYARIDKPGQPGYFTAKP